MSRCLGLLGGVGVGAAVHYYEALAGAHAAQARPLPLVMVNADMPTGLRYVQAGDLEGLAQYLAGLIGRMRDAGAELAAIPAVTPHICFDELAPISPLPLIDIVPPLAGSLRAQGVRRAALFGTRFTIESAMFGRLTDVELVTPRADEVTAIHDAYMRTANSGKGAEGDLRLLSEMAHTLIDRDGVKTIIFAGTDLSLLFDPSNTTFPAIDCAQLHIEAILRAQGL
ncbi:MAG: aspartate/glutamate racemase family protein [Alphaproteobacteria bacterium]|nr:aspartate/glutamate racemase family protein [Alphaproteobacteria bacterium]MCW5741241.1 aspartate/glutamate racemase family protein [Alphaproteobacteria bacterium]